MDNNYNKPYIYSTPENIGLKNTDIIAKEWEQILNRNQPLIIDFSNTRYVSANGVRILLVTLQKAWTRHQDIGICHAPDIIIKSLKATGFGEVLLDDNLEQYKPSKSK